MKTFALTPTCNTTQEPRTETGTLSDRAVLWQGNIHPSFRSGTGGFYLAAMLLWGPILTTEVGIEIDGASSIVHSNVHMVFSLKGDSNDS